MRELAVPAVAAGMRLDHFLARRFPDFSRTRLAKGIRAGQVRLGERVLRAGYRVREQDVLAIGIAGIAPAGEPPPLPPVLHEADGLVVLDKPAGLLCHPAGSTFAWAVIGLARERWPTVELVHRIDRDTSGCLALTTDPALNRHLKEAVLEGRVRKTYLAICKGTIPWDEAVLDGPIGFAQGPIRIQMAVCDDGKHARTDVTVVERRGELTLVRCRIHTGRTHQIRVHLAHAGFPLLGDRMYGVDPDVFLDVLEHGPTGRTFQATGAPRHALHAHELVLPHPRGPVTVRSPLAVDLQRWWDDPSVLPLDP